MLRPFTVTIHERVYPRQQKSTSEPLIFINQISLTLETLCVYYFYRKGKSSMSRFEELLVEKNVTPKTLRGAGINRFSLWWHLKGRVPEPRIAMQYCRILGMKLDKFYAYLDAADKSGENP